MLTGLAHPDDAFWLAQTYFLTGHYLRAERVLTEPLPPPALAYSNGHASMAKGKGKADEESDEQLEAVLASRPDRWGGTADETKRVALADGNLPCRYLVAQCLVCLWWSPAKS